MKEKIEELIKKSKAITKNAYAPYSNFPVGAAVLTDKGNIYTGTNVENASYGLTMCAERVAIFNAISNGERKLKYVAVYSPKREGLMPCGACLQVIKEFSTNDTSIIIIRKDKYEIVTLNSLLPSPFTFD